MFDVVIVGGGPAGLSAALALGRVRRSVLLVDSGEPRNAASPAMHNFLSRDGTPPAELRAAALAELAEYPSVRLRDAVVAGAAREGGGTFRLSLGGGETVAARRILLATGLVDELPAVEGLGALWGRCVLHCPYCHGYEVRDSPLAVLGATADRARLALHLTRLSDDVVLCTGGDGALEPEIRSRLEAHGVGIAEAPITRVERDAGGLRIDFGDGSRLARAALFVHSRTRQRSSLPRELGCTILDDGIVEVDDLGRTAAEGVYAVGDMARRPTMHAPAATVIAAAASGAMAGVAIDQDLVDVESGIRRPLAGARP